MSAPRRKEVRDTLRGDWINIYETCKDEDHLCFESLATGLVISRGYSLEDAYHFYQDMIKEGKF